MYKTFVLFSDEDIEPAEIVNPLEDDFDQLREVS